MPRRSRNLAIALAAVAVVVVAAAVIVIAPGSGRHSSSAGASSSVSAGPETGFDGASFPVGRPTPEFTLTDQYGRRVSLGQYRGQVVALTFLYSTCGDTCIVIAEQIRGALDELQAEGARPPAVLIVSADPAADSPAHVRSFLSQVSLSARVQYLTGSLSQLRSVWRAYGIKPASDGTAVFDEYAPVLLLDRAGRKRVLFESEELTPEALSHDVRKLD
ncbi:MAG: SCO family protein [Solirubrobacteraceae bacterium]|jgi:protein SCO1/2